MNRQTNPRLLSLAGLVALALSVPAVACWDSEEAALGMAEDEKNAEDAAPAPDANDPSDASPDDGGSADVDADAMVDPSLLASGIYRPVSLRVDETHVWFVEQKRDEVDPPKPYYVWRVPKAGGAKEQRLREPEEMAPSIAVDATSYYVFRRKSGSWLLESRPKDGGSATVLRSGSSAGRAITLEVDDTHVYVGSAGGFVVPKLGWGGGFPPKIRTDIAFRIYQRWVYTTRADWKVQRHLPGYATDELIADGQIGAYGLFVDGSGVYWTSQSYGTILRSPIRDADAAAPSDGGLTEIVFDFGTEPGALTGDPTHLYWAEASGRIRKVAKNGGTPEIVVADGGKADELAVDDCCVYWLDTNAGTVHRSIK